MRNFITHMVHDSLLEAARIDGASEWYIHWRIVMPIVKPAWLHLDHLELPAALGRPGGMFIYSEELKPLPYALGQIIGGGVGRAGVAAAVSVILMAVPITVFVDQPDQDQCRPWAHQGLLGIAEEGARTSAVWRLC